MESLYDVQQLLKQFGIIVYVGKRIWDIELMQIELKKLYDSRLVDRDTYPERLAHSQTGSIIRGRRQGPRTRDKWIKKS